MPGSDLIFRHPRLCTWRSLTILPRERCGINYRTRGDLGRCGPKRGEIVAGPSGSRSVRVLTETCRQQEIVRPVASGDPQRAAVWTRLPGSSICGTPKLTRACCNIGSTADRWSAMCCRRCSRNGNKASQS